MDDQQYQRTTAFEDLGPTLRSTCGEQPTRKSAPPPHIRKLVAEVGLRYRPNDRADLEAHAAKLALLAADLADIPERQLRIAIERWIATSPYLPKASDLIEIAKNSLPGRGHGRPVSEKVAMLRARCADWNAKLYIERPELTGRSEWCVDDDGNAYIHDLSAEEIAQRGRFIR